MQLSQTMISDAQENKSLLNSIKIQASLNILLSKIQTEINVASFSLNN